MKQLRAGEVNTWFREVPVDVATLRGLGLKILDQCPYQDETFVLGVDNGKALIGQDEWKQAIC